MNPEIKKSKLKKVIFISLATLAILFVGFYFFQKTQYNKASLNIPDSHLLVAKINHPLELEEKNKPFFDWCTQQPIYTAYEICEPYFSKGLQQNEYSIEDLLGDKAIYFCLDENKNNITYIPLSNNDKFFLKPLISFLDSEPLGLKKSGNFYSLTQNKRSIFFNINSQALTFSSNLEAVKNALVNEKTSEISKILSNGGKNQLIINTKNMSNLLPPKTAFIAQLENLFGRQEFQSFEFNFTTDGITFSSTTHEDSYLTNFEGQKKLASNLTSFITNSTVNFSQFATSNPHLLNDNVQAFWKKYNGGYLDKRIDVQENLNVNINDFFDNLGSNVTVLSINSHKSRLSQVLICKLTQPLPENWINIATKHIISKDTLYTLDNLPINKFLFGNTVGTSPTPYFLQKSQRLFLFEDLHAAKHYLSELATQQTWNTSKTKSKLFQSSQNKGQVSFCTFPSKNTTFLKRASELDIPLWKFLKEITQVQFDWNNGELSGDISFKASSYDEAVEKKFLPVHQLQHTASQVIPYLKPHQLAPNLITYIDNKIEIFDNYGEPIKAYKLDGEILDVFIGKDGSYFFVQTNQKHYSFDQKWNKSLNFNIPLSLHKDYLGHLKKKDHFLFFYYIDGKIVSIDDKGKIKREFTLPKGTVNFHYIEGDIYFSHITDNLLTIYNNKGKSLKNFPKNIEDFTALPPFFIKNILSIVYENGKVFQYSLDGTTNKLEYEFLKLPQLISLNNKVLWLGETSKSSVDLLDLDFNQLFSIKEPFGNEIKLSAITRDYLLIHDLSKQNAIICNRKGHLLTRSFPLSENGKVIISKNRVYRIDNFNENFELEYIKI